MFQVFLPRKWKTSLLQQYLYCMKHKIWYISFLSKYCCTKAFTLTFLAAYLWYPWNKQLLEIFLIITAKGRITTFLPWEKKKKRYKGFLLQDEHYHLQAEKLSLGWHHSFCASNKKKNYTCTNGLIMIIFIWEQIWLYTNLCNFSLV